MQTVQHGPIHPMSSGRRGQLFTRGYPIIAPIEHLSSNRFPLGLSPLASEAACFSIGYINLPQRPRFAMSLWGLTTLWGASPQRSQQRVRGYRTRINNFHEHTSALQMAQLEQLHDADVRWRRLVRPWTLVLGFLQALLLKCCRQGAYHEQPHLAGRSSRHCSVHTWIFWASVTPQISSFF